MSELDEHWFLGVTGTVAHLPQLTAAPTLRRGRIGEAPQAQCSVLLTGERAGADVPRCPACLDVAQATGTTPATATDPERS